MNIELKRKLIHIYLLDKERKTRKVIYHNPSFPEDLSLTDDMRVTIYIIENNKEILFFKDIVPNFYDIKLLGFKKVKLVFTEKVDLINFKFNPKFNLSLIF